MLAQASTASFRIVAFMPAVLLIVFGLVWLNDRRKGGFRPERLSANDRATSTRRIVNVATLNVIVGPL